MSLFFKSIAVRRIYDQKNDTLIYVAYSRQITDASAKMGLSTVSLYNTHPISAGAKAPERGLAPRWRQARRQPS
jgi:CreA protein